MTDRIIVTGAAGFIGTEVCKYLSAIKHPRKIEVIPCDLAFGDNLGDEGYVKEWFNKHKAEYLVNLFAINDHVDPNRAPHGLFDIPLSSFNHMLNCNVTSLFSVCREYARNNEKGAIVNFSSTCGLVSPDPRIYKGSVKHPGYCVSKGAVVTLTQYLAVHLAPNVRVNCIAPGGVKRDQGASFISDYSDRTPLGRMMDLNEVGGLVEFLCSSRSSYMTGSIITLDGGWTAW